LCDGFASLWAADPEALIAEANGRLARNLTLV